MNEFWLAVQRINNTDPRRVQAGDIIDFKPVVMWNVNSNGEFEQIQVWIKDQAWLKSHKDEIYNLYMNQGPGIENPAIRAERFKRIWANILERGIRDSGLLPASIAGKFNRVSGASLFHRYGMDVFDSCPGEKASFHLPRLEGEPVEKVTALCEEWWDTDSYQPYKPQMIEEYEKVLRAKADLKANPVKAHLIIDTDLAKFYADYLEGLQERCEMPGTHKTKRRFSVPDAENKSVVTRLDCLDKLRERSVQEADGLNFIKPLIFEAF